MAYTTANLQTFFTNANGGVAPTSAQTLTLTALANQNAAGTLTDAQALAQTIDLASDTTTAVSVETYQFFTGSAPSQAGIAYLNQAFTGTGAQASLNGENRFIAQSVALVLGNTAAKTAFTTTYGSLSIADATKAAYNIIVGNAAAAAAGINVDAAINFLTSASSIAYYTAYVKANTPATTTAADLDLAVKAAIIGEIMYTSTTFNNGAGVGSYATATTNLIKDLADDGLLTANNVNGINLFTNYGTPATSTPGTTVALTTNVDAQVGTANDDTYVGTLGTGATINAGDTIDGGAGTDTLSIFTADGKATLPAMNIKNVEVVTVNNTDTANTLTLDANSVAGVTSFLSTGQGNVTVSNIGASASVGFRDVAITGTSTVTAVGARIVNITGVTQGASGKAAVDVSGTNAQVGSSLSIVNSGKASAITNLTFGGTDKASTTGLSFNIGAATTIKTLTQSSANELKTISVTGNGALTITDAFTSTALTTVDASTNSGGLTLNLGSIAALTSLKGSAAADTITLTGGLLGTAVVDLGAGNDRLTIDTAPTTGATINGGDGTDTLVLTADVYTAATRGQFTGFENVTLSGVKIADATQFAGFAQIGITGTTTVANVGANPTFVLEGGTTAATITLANATGASDVVNLTLGTAGKSSVSKTSTIDIANVETLNVNSLNGGTSSAPGTNYLAVTTNDNALSKVVVTGAGQFSLDVANAQRALNVDASAATAGFELTSSSASVVNVIGSNQADSITGSKAGGQINAGKGGDLITLYTATNVGDDTIVLKAGDSSLDLTTGVSSGLGGKSAMDTIVGFKAAGTDKIDLTQISGFGSTGQGVANATVASSADLATLLATTGVFKDGGGLQRGVLDIQVNGTLSTHYVVVDVNHDGNYTAGTDLVVMLTGATTSALVAADFNFGS